MKISQEHVTKMRGEFHGVLDRISDHLWLNALAAIIAACGLIQGSTAVIIGAMLIATLLIPLGAVGFGAAVGEWHVFKLAVDFLIKSSAVVFVIGFILGLLLYHEANDEMLLRTQPNMLDLFIAVAGGAATTYITAAPKLAGAAAGAAIATALVPPLVTSGLFFSDADFGHGFGAFMLFSVNLVAIAVANMATFMLLGCKSSNNMGPYRFAAYLRWVLIGLLALVMIVLALMF